MKGKKQVARMPGLIHKSREKGVNREIEEGKKEGST